MVSVVVTALAVLLGGVSQAVSGIGFSLVSGPFLVAALGAKEGIRLSVLLSLVLNVGLLVRHRAEVDRRGALLLLVPAAVSTPGWVVLVRALPERPARAAAGAVVVLGAGLLASGLRWRAATGRVGAVAVGVVAALTNVIAAVAGPPVALWAENAGWAPDRQRATLQAFFLGLNVVALAALGVPSVAGWLLVASLVAMAVGAAVGGRLRVPELWARRVTLSLAAAGGAVVLVRALVSG